MVLGLLQNIQNNAIQSANAAPSLLKNKSMSQSCPMLGSQAPGNVAGSYSKGSCGFSFVPEIWVGAEGGSKFNHTGLSEWKRLLLKARLGDGVSQRSPLRVSSRTAGVEQHQQDSPSHKTPLSGSQGP